MPASTSLPNPIVTTDRFHIISQGSHADILVSNDYKTAIKAWRGIPPSRCHADTASASWASNLHVGVRQYLGSDGHPNICPQKIIVQGNTALAFSMPFFRKGNIIEFLAANFTADMMILVKDIASGLLHIHNMGFIHGNFCPRNVLITGHERAVISDAGANAKIRQIFLEQRGHAYVPASWMYKAPEDLLPADEGVGTDIQFTPAMDVYSFACTVYSLYTLTSPLPRYLAHQGAIRGIQEIIRKGHREILYHLRPIRMEPILWDLLQHCWSLDPSERPGMSEVVEALQRM